MVAQLEGASKCPTGTMKSRDVNEFLIATFSVNVFNGPWVLSTFTGRILIPTKRQRAPTIRELYNGSHDRSSSSIVSSLGVSIASLAREIILQYTRILRINSFTSMWDSLFIKESKSEESDDQAKYFWDKKKSWYMIQGINPNILFFK